jgi:hypothetical protein
LSREKRTILKKALFVPEDDCVVPYNLFGALALTVQPADHFGGSEITACRFHITAKGERDLAVRLRPAPLIRSDQS